MRLAVSSQMVVENRNVGMICLLLLLEKLRPFNCNYTNKTWGVEI